MIIGKEMEVVEGLPVLYIKSLKALIVSDLHLGYEGGMAKEGIAIPKANLKSIIVSLGKAFEGREIGRIIVVGDIKNDFSGVIAEELNELREIIEFVKGKGASMELVMGNHDNFMATYSNALGIKVHQHHLLLSGYLFAHGDKPLETLDAEVSSIIIGHEHPSIGIRSKLGTIERLRCFLYGRIPYSGKMTELVVLPAVGYFETGSDINLHSKKRIMSPILRRIDVDKMEAIAVGHGSTLNFGKIGSLRGLEI